MALEIGFIQVIVKLHINIKDINYLQKKSFIRETQIEINTNRGIITN